MLGTSRVGAAMLASVLLAGTVLAQPTKPPTDKEKQKAGELVKQAIAKSQDRDHLAAISLYLEAYAVVPLPTLLSNVGTEYQQVQKPIEALKYFCMYLEKDPAGALVTYATAQARVLQIELGNPVDETNVCKPPTPIASGPDAPGNGSGSTTELSTTASTTPPGSTDPGKNLRTMSLVITSVGIVSLGFGVGFGVAAKNISDDISSHMGTPWRNDIRDYEERGLRDEKLQITFLVTGGLLVAGGTIIYLMNRKPSPESMTVTPTATPNGGGVVFSGQF